MNRKVILALATVVLSPFTPSLLSGSDAAELWNQHCKKCHGEGGAGDTRMGKKLQVQDYTDPAVQAKMTDEQMTKVILEGKDDESGKRLMAPFADKLTAEEVASLVAYIRAMKKD